MNILFYFVNNLNPQQGGTERVANKLAISLKERGHNVYCVHRIDSKEDYGIEHFLMPCEKGNCKLNIDFISDLIYKLKIDVVINERGESEDVYLFSKEIFKNTKIVTHLHFSPYISYKYFYKQLYLPLFSKDFLINILKRIKAPYNRYNMIKNCARQYRYTIDNSDKVVTLAPSYIEEIKEISGLQTANNICSIYNPQTYNNTKYNISEKENMVLYVGRLTYNPKRIDLLLNVWQNIQTYLKDWKLMIVGDGPDSNRLKEICLKKRLKNVYFEGNQDPEPYYKRAKILCMTSIYEGTPMVITEAMQHGCVPITYNTFSAANDMISDEHDGFLITPFNSKEYKEKLILLTDYNTYKSMSLNAFNATKKFDFNAIIDSWEDMLLKLINE